MSIENRVILGIAAAVLVWGVFHATGAYLFNHNPWRPVIVMACVAGFLAFWFLMLRSQKRRSRIPPQEL